MNITKLIIQIGELPTLPMVAARINQEIHNEALTAKLLGEIIIDDAALAAKILRLANSAFYGLQKQVTTLNKAVMVLGFNTVKNLALSVSIHSLFKKQTDSRIDLEGLWRHSLGCAAAAKIIIANTNVKLGEEAFLFGILHDIGKILIIHSAPREYEKILQLMQEENIPEKDAELQVIETTHQKLGAMLLEHWKFPDAITQAVKFHHETDLKKKKLSPEMESLTFALFLGNQMSKALMLGRSSNPVRAEVPKFIWQALNIKHNQLNDMSTAIRKNYSILLETWEMEGNDDT
ncbi:MAG: HDOD domain-containing protein [Pseudomonadota bacterium]